MKALLTLTLCLSFASPICVSAAEYGVSLLAGPGWDTVAFDINSSGMVAGELLPPATKSQACRWDSSIAYQEIYVQPQDFSEGWGQAINSAGVVAGGFETYQIDSPRRACKWSYDGMWRREDLKTLSPGHGWSWAYAINDSGQVAGYSNNADSKARAVIWDGGIREIDPTLGTESWAYDIDNTGAVVGTFQSENSNGAFFWTQNSGTTILPNRGVACTATGISNGVICGYLTMPGSTLTTACYWTCGLSCWEQHLLNLDGYAAAYADDVNVHGYIVGRASTNGRDFLPCLWREGQLVTLPLPAGFSTGSGVAISDSGFIIGNVGNSPVLRSAVEWAAVPEPSTTLPLAMGVTFALTWMRRKKRM